MKHLIYLLAALALLAPCIAGEWRSKGEITAESRLFSDDDNEATEDAGLGLFARVETRYKEKGWQLKLRAFSRVDDQDHERDITALEEAWFGYQDSGWDVRLGFQMLNWTSTEAFHPADIMNSRNLDSNIENPEKLGELMLSVKRSLGQGSLTLYYLPRYEEPQIPGPTSRLSFVPAGVTIDRPIWLEGDGDMSSDSAGNQWGARFSQTIGDADVSIHYLDHMDRQQPAFQLNEEVGVLRPVYSRVKDLGVTYAHVLGAWLFKLEAGHKDFEEQTGSFATFNVPDHVQTAFGLEYGWSSLNGSDTTLLLEGQGLFDVEEAERERLSVFQRDILLGYRYSWNDVMGRELLVTTIIDLERSHEYLFNLSYKQRLSDTWSIHTGLRWIDAPLKEMRPVGLENLDESNQIFLNLTRYF